MVSVWRFADLDTAQDDGIAQRPAAPDADPHVMSRDEEIFGHTATLHKNSGLLSGRRCRCGGQLGRSKCGPKRADQAYCQDNESDPKAFTSVRGKRPWRERCREATAESDGQTTDDFSRLSHTAGISRFPGFAKYIIAPGRAREEQRG